MTGAPSLGVSTHIGIGKPLQERGGAVEHDAEQQRVRAHRVESMQSIRGLHRKLSLYVSVSGGHRRRVRLAHEERAGHGKDRADGTGQECRANPARKRLDGYDTVCDEASPVAPS